MAAHGTGLPQSTRQHTQVDSIAAGLPTYTATLLPGNGPMVGADVLQVGQLSLKTEEGAQAAAQLLEQCPAIIKASAKQLHDKAARTRAGMFQARMPLLTT